MANKKLNAVITIGGTVSSSLRAAFGTQAPVPYTPQRRVLSLLATGDRRAIASWGRWSAEGAWVWHWKDRIDRGFVERFNPAVQSLKQVLDKSERVISIDFTRTNKLSARITDVDVANESTQLARFNILVQSGTAMLSQANQSSQIALKLLG